MTATMEYQYDAVEIWGLTHDTIVHGVNLSEPLGEILQLLVGRSDQIVVRIIGRSVQTIPQTTQAVQNLAQPRYPIANAQPAQHLVRARRLSKSPPGILKVVREEAIHHLLCIGHIRRFLRNLVLE